MNIPQIGYIPDFYRTFARANRTLTYDSIIHPRSFVLF